jgi:Tfp pilus assembly protein PilF
VQKGFNMKSLLRGVLLSLVVLPIAACGGERGDVSTAVSPVGPGSAGVSVPEHVAPVKPVVPGEQVVAVEVPDVTPTTYVDALALGKQLAAKGAHARAREIFELAIKLDKQQVDPHIELARLFIATGDRARAIKSATKAVKMAPGSSQAYNTLGRAELARFDYDGAIAAFRQATELNPDNVWAWNNLGYTYLQLAQYQEAADALAEATSRPGTTGYMWNNLGTAYEHLDQLDDARLAYENGGGLGSVEATASRKRLEGVDSIAIAAPAPRSEKTYELKEEMPPLDPEVLDDVESDADAEPEGDDAPKVELDAGEAKVHDEVRAEPPVAPASPI